MKVDPRNGKYKIIAEINMIPFIDVALVLLIIFMVMTPFLVKSQLKVNLPKAESADQAADEKDMIDVQVDKDGAISVNGQTVAPDTVEAVLRNVLLDVENQPVVIHADREVPFQAVVTVMDAAKKIGVAKLGVGVKQEASSAAGQEKARHRFRPATVAYDWAVSFFQALLRANRQDHKLNSHLVAAKVQDREQEHAADGERQLVGLPRGRQKTEDRVRPAGDGHSDRQNVIDKQGASRHHARRWREQSAGHEVSAAAGRELLDDLRVACAEEENRHHRDQRDNEAQVRMTTAAR